MYFNRQLILFLNQDEVVNIRLPKFRLQNHQSVGVVQALKAMGIRDVLDSQLSDLSGVSAHHLHVSNVIHKWVQFSIPF